MNPILTVVLVVVILLWAANQFVQENPLKKWKPTTNTIVLAVLIVWVVLEWLSPGTLRLPR